MKTNITSQVGCIGMMAMFILLAIRNLTKAPPADANGMPIFGISVFSICLFSMLIGFCISNILHELVKRREEKEMKAKHVNG